MILKHMTADELVVLKELTDSVPWSVLMKALGGQDDIFRERLFRNDDQRDNDANRGKISYGRDIVRLREWCDQELASRKSVASGEGSVA